MRGQTRHAGVLTKRLFALTHYIWGVGSEQALPLVSRHEIDILLASVQEDKDPSSRLNKLVH